MVPRHRRTGLTAATAALLGAPVRVAVPLQRHRPGLVLAVCVAEIVSLVAFVATGNGILFALLLVFAVAMLAVGSTNRHRVLAISDSALLVLAATARFRPCGVVGPAPDGLTVPLPAGLGIAVALSDGTWWVDRSAFARAERARQLLQADRQDERGEGEDDAGTDGDAVEVPFHHR